MLKTMKSFGQDESGATAIEYTLIAGAIGLAIIISVVSIGSTLNGTFADVVPGLT